MKHKSAKSSAQNSSQRDNTGVTTLVSNVIDIDAIPCATHEKHGGKSHKIKIIDSSGKNVVSAVRES